MWFAQTCPTPFELDPPPPHCKYSGWDAYLGVSNMVKRGIQEILRWPCVNRTPSQKLRPHPILPDFKRGLGGPVRRERDIFGQNTFSNISFNWPQDQESTQCRSNFPNLINVNQSYDHACPTATTCFFKVINLLYPKFPTPCWWKSDLDHDGLALARLITE